LKEVADEDSKAIVRDEEKGVCASLQHQTFSGQATPVNLLVLSYLHPNDQNISAHSIGHRNMRFLLAGEALNLLVFFCYPPALAPLFRAN
jgi:hypothetical protein